MTYDQRAVSVAFEVLLQYALWISGGRLQVHGLVRRVASAAPTAPFDEQLARLHAALVEEERWRDTAAALRPLATVLRAAPAAIAVDHPAIGGDARRLQVLQWTMKRDCLLQLLLCLPLDARAAWVLRTRLGADVARTAALMRVPVAAVDAHLVHARRSLAALLGRACEHLDPGNPCRCADRIAAALQHGLLREVSPLLPEQAHDEVRGLALDELYRSLPSADLESAAARAAAESAPPRGATPGKR